MARPTQPWELEDLVERRELDFALTHLPVSNPALQIHPLAALEFLVVGRHDDSRLLGTETFDYAALTDVPLILLRRSSGAGIYERITDAFQRAGISFTIVADSADVSATFALIRRGIGLGLLPLWKGGELPPDLMARPFQGDVSAEQIAMIHARGRRLIVSQRVV